MNYLQKDFYFNFLEYMKNINEFKNELSDISKKWE